MKHATTLLILAFVATQGVSSGPNPKSWKAASWLYGASVALDIYSTDLAGNTGHTVELNPLMGRYPSDRVLYFRGAAISGGIYLGLDKLKETRPKLALTALWIFAASHLFFAVHNYRLEQQIRSEFPEFQ